MKKKIIAFIASILVLSLVFYVKFALVKTEISPRTIESYNDTLLNVGDILYGVSYDNSDDKFYEDDNGIVSVKLEIHNITDETTIGFMVFLNGVVQEIILNNNSQNPCFLNEITFAAASKSTVTLQFIPKTDKYDTLIDLRVLTMLKPSGGFNPSNFSFGNLHSVMLLNPSKELVLDSDSGIAIQHDVAWDQIDIQFDKYLIDETVIENTPYAFLYSENPLSPTLSNTKSSLTFDFFDNMENQYRTTFFVNHQPICINSGAKYLEFMTQPGKAVSKKIFFNADLSSGSFVYSISIPINKDNQNVVKTRTQILLAE